MKTKTTITIAGLLMTAAMLLFISTASAQCPPAGKCQGNCPTLFRSGANAPINVPPWSADGTGKCHKVKPPGGGNADVRCACEYRVSGSENNCVVNTSSQLCGGDCPTLYPTAQDAIDHTNPITFGHIECHTFTTNNVPYCTCIYY